MTTRMGSNQYFLRVRRKVQNSLRNRIIRSRASELVEHAFSRRPRRIALDPVASSLCVRSQPERIFPEQAEQESDRRYYQEEEESHHDGSDHAAEQQA